ncbi:MAG: glycosyl hydrolase family 18 protein [Candidatus Berkelbacteria bacterium]|nr:glycosyl hydrolase family 18 protein [Candidatus Berkelbacteria bacterium]
MKRGLALVLVLILGLIAGFAGGYYYSLSGLSKKTAEQPTTTTATASKSPAAVAKLDLSQKVNAWLVWWDQEKGFESLKQNAASISSVRPFWYRVEESGSIEKLAGAEDQEIIGFAKANKIKVVATITNDSDPDLVGPIITDSAKIDLHIRNILKLVEKNGYDGIEIDYESLLAKNKEAYTSFMSKLSVELKKQNKTLATALHAKTEEPGTWDGPQAQDWTELGKICDEVKIMTYDYHWATSEAGAISPLDWTEDVIKLAVKEIPKEKIYLGVPFYGYDWVEENATDLTWQDVQKIVKKNNPTVKSDGASKESYFSYQKEDKNHEVWFNNSESVKSRAELAKKYSLQGIGIWRLGREDPGNWQAIQETFKK